MEWLGPRMKYGAEMVRLARLLPYHTSQSDPIVRLQLKVYLDMPLWPSRVDS